MSPTMRTIGRTARIVCPASLGLLLGALLSVVTFPSMQDAGCLIDDDFTAMPPVDASLLRRMQFYADNPKSPPGQPFEAIVVRSDVTSRTTASTTKQKKVVRPKYFASEVNMRDKLFVVVLLEDAHSVDHPTVVALNQTITHHVSKAVFVQFVTPDNVYAEEEQRTADDTTTHLNVLRIGTQHDAKHARLVTLLEYLIMHKIVDNYDWLFVMPSSTYLKAVKLHELVSHMSIGRPTLMGRPDDQGYCNFENGMILSQELLQSFKTALPSCLPSLSPSASPSTNLGRCLRDHLGVVCAADVDNKTYRSVELTDDGVDDQLAEYVDRSVRSGVGQDAFNGALTVRPVETAVHVHTLHKYYCALEIEALSVISSSIQQELDQIDFESNATRRYWPSDVVAPSRPRTRYEAHKSEFFTATHLFDNRPNSIAVPLASIDKADVDDVVDEARRYIERSSLPASTASFVALDSGYRLFDPTRGMEYSVDLQFVDAEGNTLTERIHMLRPLTRTEIIPSVPFVSEASNITIILPLATSDVAHIHAFIRHLRPLCQRARAQRTFDRVVTVLYDDKFRSTAGGADRQAVTIGELRASLHAVQGECAPSITFELIDERQSTQRTVAQIVHSVVQTKGANRLYFVINVWTQLAAEFLNRVRLGAIRQYQVMSCVPFAQYNPRITAKDAAPLNAAQEEDELGNDLEQQSRLGGNDYLKVNDVVDAPTRGNDRVEVHKDQGRFATDDRYFVAFYGDDWLTSVAHKGGLANVLRSGDASNLMKIFVARRDLHVFRAPDPLLLVHYHALECDPRDGDDAVYARCLRGRRTGLASKAQLAKLILASKEENK